MVITECRERLSDTLRRLLDGEMTVGEFSEVCEELEDAPDRAMANILEFAEGLFEGYFLIPKRLTGRYAVKPLDRDVAVRCMLFLETEREYEWPEWHGGCLIAPLIALLAAPGLVLGLIMLVLAIVVLCTKGEWEGFLAIMAFAALGLTWGIALPVFLYRWFWRRVRECVGGDEDCWPFFRARDYQQAESELKWHLQQARANTENR